MRGRFRIALAALACFALTSCSYTFVVRAVFVGGALTFVSGDDDETHSPWCWNSFTIFSDSGEPMWEFDAYEAYRDAASCGPNFPLAYGRAPTGAQELIGPQHLEPGRLYVISGDAAGSLTGAFTYYRSGRQWVLDNIDPDSPEVEAAEENHQAWANAHRPARQVTDVGAAGGEPTEREAFMIPQDEAAGPAGVDQQSWQPLRNFASLAYTSLDERETALKLWCRWRGHLIVELPQQPGTAGASLQLASERQQATVMLRPYVSRDHRPTASGVMLENSPVLRSFERSGRLSLRMGNRRIAVDAINEQERENVRRFLAGCRADRIAPDAP